MAEVVGLAASIIQIAGTGAQLSMALYNYTNLAANADPAIKDIADDIELTTSVLENVGKLFETEDAKSIVSKGAIRDVNKIIKKCEYIFDEISKITDKRRKLGKDGEKKLSMLGKLAWPLKEPRVELHRKRLETLKSSLLVLLGVLHLGQGQLRGKREQSIEEAERQSIRELYQRYQESSKNLEALEARFRQLGFEQEESTVHGSKNWTGHPTSNFMVDSQSLVLPPLEKDSTSKTNIITIDLSTVDDSDTSENEAIGIDYNDEQLSLEDLAKAAEHVKKLLGQITMLQQSSDENRKTRRRLRKMYQRFCHRFESGIQDSQHDPLSVRDNIMRAKRGRCKRDAAHNRRRLRAPEPPTADLMQWITPTTTTTGSIPARMQALTQTKQSCNYMVGERNARTKAPPLISPPSTEHLPQQRQPKTQWQAEPDLQSAISKSTDLSDVQETNPTHEALPKNNACVEEQPEAVSRPSHEPTNSLINHGGISPHTLVTPPPPSYCYQGYHMLAPLEVTTAEMNKNATLDNNNEHLQPSQQQNHSLKPLSSRPIYYDRAVTFDPLLYSRSSQSQDQSHHNSMFVSKGIKRRSSATSTIDPRKIAAFESSEAQVASSAVTLDNWMEIRSLSSADNGWVDVGVGASRGWDVSQSADLRNVGERDIVDVLLEKWTVSVCV